METKIIKTMEKDVEELVIKADVLISNTIRNINYELINMYWELGKMITNYKKANNSKYGDAVITFFKEKLYKKYGSGFGETNIKLSINFYNVFKKSPPADFFKNISWSHYREIISSNDKKRICFYLNEVVNKKLTKLELRDSN